MKSLRDNFFEILNKLFENQGVREAKNIKIYYNFIMIESIFESFLVSNVRKNQRSHFFEI